MVQSYDAGRSDHSIPLSGELLYSLVTSDVVKLDPIYQQLWKLVCDELHKIGIYNGIDHSPPRRRPDSAKPVIIDFVSKHPGVYCTRELVQRLNLNENTTANVMWKLRKDGIMDKTKDGKWFLKGGVVPKRATSARGSVTEIVHDFVRKHPNQYTAIEIARRHPNLNAASVRNALNKSKTARINADKKWSTR